MERGFLVSLKNSIRYEVTTRLAHRSKKTLNGFIPVTIRITKTQLLCRALLDQSDCDMTGSHVIKVIPPIYIS